MKLVFDIDGVLADFIAGFTAMANAMFPGVPVTRTHEQPSWRGFPGMTETQVAAVWERIKTSRVFWLSLSPLITPAESERVNDLQIEHDVYFCTARVGKYAKNQTEDWLTDHGIWRPSVVISNRKGEFCKAVQADAAIDDKAANASFIDWNTDGRTRSYLLDRPYNRVPQEFMASGVRRVSSLTEFLEGI